MTDQNTRAVIGDNRPPPFDPDEFDKFQTKVSDFLDAAGDWLDLKEVETEEQSEKLTDFVSGARAVFRGVDDARKAAKKPHDDAGKEVQAAFTPLLDKLERAVKKVKALQTAYLTKKDEAHRREQARLAAEAEVKRKAAEKMAAAAAARNDINAEVDAEEAMKEADRLAKEATRITNAKVGSATGGGRSMALRTLKEVEITNINVLFMHFRNHPDVAETLRRLAQAEVRSAGYDHLKSPIPGITITERKVAA